MTSEINQWALRHNVSFLALAELQAIFGLQQCESNRAGFPQHSEAYVQSLVRLEAGRKGLKLWRNNVGVLQNEAGQPIRYGLANDSPALNKKIKSGDLIGWRPIRIGTQHIGQLIAQFVSRECKRPDWTFTGTERETAQLKWAQTITADGGDASFVTGEGSL